MNLTQNRKEFNRGKKKSNKFSNENTKHSMSNLTKELKALESNQV